eukprot:CAMPEP_0196811630 /NCGR_PEP_ID=MMETSP1362-20130617/19232_1 /TAXON_ID=163516 /ORGANISM="Leptocylindrus danicus, Strain CCMP1856" /LENGTH=627 /DNA_ID=CAMNT_0042186981 /DNA_START=140 /DNA_END=2020 /DNA_ORIENTATION=-
MKVTSCRTISSWQDFTEALDSPDEKGNVVNFCPFDITHDGDETDGYDVTTDFLRVSCDKKTGTAGDAIEQVLSNGGRRRASVNYELGPISQEDPPKCIIRGSARHLNVNSKGFTMIGFDFYDSEHTAVLIGDDATQANLLHCAFVDNVTQGSGGAITVSPSASKTTIFHCEFTSNEAMEGGGAIAHSEGADLTVYRSYFHLNHATSDGAAMSSATALTLSRSEFFQNTVESAKGPAIYDSDSTACDAGENIACLNSDVTTGEECDGFYSVADANAVTGSCHEFTGSCEAPSLIPTAAPIVSPTAAPTGQPTASPTISHVPTPYPTRSPTDAPTASPSHAPSCAPSFSPTVSPPTVSVPIQIGEPNPPVPVPVPAPPTVGGTGSSGKGSSGKGGTRAPTHASHKHGHTHNSHNGGKGASQHNHTHNSHESHKHHHMSHTHPLHEGSNHKSKAHTHTSAGKGGSTDAAHVVGHVGSKHTHENHTHGSKKIEDAAAATEPVAVSNDTNRRQRRLSRSTYYHQSSKTTRTQRITRDLEEEDVPHTHKTHANSGHTHNHSHKSAGKGSAGKGDGGDGVNVPGAGTDKCAPGPPLPPLPDRKLDAAAVVAAADEEEDAHASGGSLRKRRNLHW